MKPFRVVIINRIFSHYRKPIFDELNKYINLRVIHATDKSGMKNEQAEYSRLVKNLFYGKKSSQVWLFTCSALLRFNPKVIIHEFNPSILSLHITYLYAKIFSKKFIVWGHGYNRSIGFNPKTSFKNKVRLWYLKNADAVLLYGFEGKREMSNYIQSEKVFIAQNTLDTDSLVALRDEYDLLGKDILKIELGIKERFNLLFIGRLIKEKEPELLIGLNEILIEKNLDVAIHFIGDGEAKGNIENIVSEKGFSNIYFHGAIHDENISSKYLFISDIMIIPGGLGLSVNHALCFDSPVVSFKKTGNGPVHGPEVEYVINNETGYLAKNYDINDMAKWIINYLLNPKLQRSMKTKIRDSVINTFPKSKMVNGIMESIRYVQNKNAVPIK